MASFVSAASSVPEETLQIRHNRLFLRPKCTYSLLKFHVIRPHTAT